MDGLTRDHVYALVERSDLLEAEASLHQESGLTWAGRLNQLGSYGTSGGSAGDRRLIVEALTILEATRKG